MQQTFQDKRPINTDDTKIDKRLWQALPTGLQSLYTNMHVTTSSEMLLPKKPERENRFDNNFRLTQLST